MEQNLLQNANYKGSQWEQVAFIVYERENLFFGKDHSPLKHLWSLFSQAEEKVISWLA